MAYLDRNLLPSLDNFLSVLASAREQKRIKIAAFSDKAFYRKFNNCRNRTNLIGKKAKTNLAKRQKQCWGCIVCIDQSCKRADYFSPNPKTNLKSQLRPKKPKVKLGLKNLAMLPSYFDYIFVHLRQKVRLRPELSPKFFVDVRTKPGPNPTRKARPDLHVWYCSSQRNCFYSRLIDFCL